MIRQPIIYGLFDPRNGELRYVGKSANGLARCASHVCPSSLRAVTRKNGWLKSLLKFGLKPEAAELEPVPTVDELDEAERHWIAAMRFIGCRLTNMTDGGDGQIGIKFSDEHRAKMSAALKGKRRGPMPRWVAEKIGRANIGKRRSLSAIAATAAKRRGQKHTAESIAKMSAAHLANASRPEHGVKLSRAHGGRPFVDHLERRYETVSEAARETGISASHISRVLRGLKPFTSGFTFRFIT